MIVHIRTWESRWRKYWARKWQFKHQRSSYWAIRIDSLQSEIWVNSDEYDRTGRQQHQRAGQALQVAIENGLDGHNNIEQIAHAFAMLCMGANAVAQLRVLTNAPRELRGVVGGSILPADIFSDDSIESIKRNLDLRKVDQLNNMNYNKFHPGYELKYIYKEISQIKKIKVLLNN
ncbi:MAG: hypothetical protein EZS28_008729 [Streblomastix strix]|uniref:Uncharacterized protein n=1 Tax=Streblomastix strix TaxID=222440 RepID=A0A5J4WLK1_9EUKA|nr:MAG: hypothetical protein EZS28_008729 [Streblomastix strix]